MGSLHMVEAAAATAPPSRDRRENSFIDTSPLRAAEKAPLVVIPTEVRNLSVFETQEKRDSSARSVPRFTVNVHRERNDNVLSFSATCKVQREICEQWREHIFPLTGFTCFRHGYIRGGNHGRAIGSRDDSPGKNIW